MKATRLRSKPSSPTRWRRRPVTTLRLFRDPRVGAASPVTSPGHLLAGGGVERRLPQVGVDLLGVRRDRRARDAEMGHDGVVQAEAPLLRPRGPATRPRRPPDGVRPGRRRPRAPENASPGRRRASCSSTEQMAGTAVSSPTSNRSGRGRGRELDAAVGEAAARCEQREAVTDGGGRRPASSRGRRDRPRGGATMSTTNVVCCAGAAARRGSCRCACGRARWPAARATSRTTAALAPSVDVTPPVTGSGNTSLMRWSRRERPSTPKSARSGPPRRSTRTKVG